MAAAVAVPLGEHVLDANGNYIFPASALTEARIIAGSGALVAVTAVAVLALGAILRRSAGAVTAGVVVFVLPYVLGSAVSGSAEQWLFRLTPAAGFSVLGRPAPTPRWSATPTPWPTATTRSPPGPASLVLCAYAAVALGVATVLLRRRDA